VTKVEKSSTLEEAIKIAEDSSRNSKVVIEEFVEGQLYSHSAFIQDGEILVDFFVDEFCTVYPYQVDSSCISQNLSDKLKSDIREDIEKLVKLLNLKDGLLHTQIISNGENFWIIETMRRCPGDLYGTLIRKSTGFNYAEFYAKPFLNQKNSIERLKLESNFVARHTISVSSELTFKSLKYRLNPEKLDIYPLKESGYKLKEAPFDKVALVFYEFDTQKELIDNTKNMKDYFIVDRYEGV
jgi:predicted ATP-grasp superfamily ATP-dependent carboligase